eukprot:TRINITY_DN17580_c0_g1_i2.p1 TRINITY_DN17580_c0_g1~~TRINITY_DN17580_c0_g1_i2.p1  ORF type:complete len:465 (-),score=90.96 TRINITY_DN17580_c0_g1_i2:178-1572(-)
MAALAGLWWVGVLLEVLSTMSGTIGKQLIRMSETKKRSNPAFAAMCFHVGIVVNTLVGPIVDMAAYSFAPQSLIAPFGGLDVVWNALLAPYILHEKLTKMRAFGCFLVVVGTSITACFGNHTDSEYTLEYLEDTLISLRVLIYFLVFFAWFAFNRFFLMKFPQGSPVRGFSLGATAGTIAGNMFCVKAAIELIQKSLHELDGEVWLSWLTYALLFGAIFFALTNVIYMTAGLKEYEALFMVTVYEGSMIVSGCVSGTVVLLDMKSVEPWRIALYFFGLSVIMSGMYVIFSQEEKSNSSLIAGTASIKIEDAESNLEMNEAGEGEKDVAKAASARTRAKSLDAMLKGQSFHAKPRHLTLDAAQLASVGRSMSAGHSSSGISSEATGSYRAGDLSPVKLVRTVSAPATVNSDPSPNKDNATASGELSSRLKDASEGGQNGVAPSDSEATAKPERVRGDSVDTVTSI